MEEGTDVEVAGTHLIEEADGATVILLRIEVECQALSQSYVDAELCGERLIIFIRVTPRLTPPELMPINGIDINARLQRLQGKPVVEADAPRNVILLHGVGKVVVCTVIFRNDAPQDLRLPLSALAVRPAYSVEMSPILPAFCNTNCVGIRLAQ